MHFSFLSISIQTDLKFDLTMFHLIPSMFSNLKIWILSRKQPAAAQCFDKWDKKKCLPWDFLWHGWWHQLSNHKQIWPACVHNSDSETYACDCHDPICSDVAFISQVAETMSACLHLFFLPFFLCTKTPSPEFLSLFCNKLDSDFSSCTCHTWGWLTSVWLF